MTERRGSSRVRVRISVRYRSNAVSVHGWACDLSQTGVFVRSNFVEAQGTEVSLAIELPDDSRPLPVDGVVVRAIDAAEGRGMGIRFEEIDESIRLKLANFMIERSYESLHQV